METYKVTALYNHDTGKRLNKGGDYNYYYRDKALDRYDIADFSGYTMEDVVEKMRELAGERTLKGGARKLYGTIVELRTIYFNEAG